VYACGNAKDEHRRLCGLPRCARDEECHKQRAPECCGRVKSSLVRGSAATIVMQNVNKDRATETKQARLEWMEYAEWTVTRLDRMDLM
jgi:hypothetical protein